MIVHDADLLDVALGLCHASDDPADRSIWAEVADLVNDYPALSHAYRVAPLFAGAALYVDPAGWAAIWSVVCNDDVTEVHGDALCRMLVLRDAVEIIQLHPIGEA